NQCESQRVRAVFLDDFQRIDYVPARFRHFYSMRVANNSMQVKLPEGNSLFGFRAWRQMQVEHHHPRVPEEEDVVSADQQTRRIKRAQIFSVVRPAKSG